MYDGKYVQVAGDSFAGNPGAFVPISVANSTAATVFSITTSAVLVVKKALTSTYNGYYGNTGFGSDPSQPGTIYFSSTLVNGALECFLGDANAVMCTDNKNQQNFEICSGYLRLQNTTMADGGCTEVTTLTAVRPN